MFVFKVLIGNPFQSTSLKYQPLAEHHQTSMKALPTAPAGHGLWMLMLLILGLGYLDEGPEITHQCQVVEAVYLVI